MTTGPFHSIFFSVALALIICVQTAESIWTMEIGAYDEACFVVRTSGKPRLLTGNYAMLDPLLSAEPLLVYIMEEEKVVWHSKPNSPFDAFHVTMLVGLKYWLCLQNTSHGPLHEGDEPDHMDELPRKVGFNYRISADPSKMQIPKIGEGLGLDQKTEDWIDVSSDINDDLKDYYDHFDYAKRREADHRTMVEQTFTDIFTWTVLEAGMVIMSAVGQVFFYRRYLEKKRTYY
jgi:hypothetical protein